MDNYLETSNQKEIIDRDGKDCERGSLLRTDPMESLVKWDPLSNGIPGQMGPPDQMGSPDQMGPPGQMGQCGPAGMQVARETNGNNGTNGKDLVHLAQYINEIGTYDISSEANIIILNSKQKDTEKLILWLPKLKFLEPNGNGLFTPLCVEIYRSQEIEYVINAAEGDTINGSKCICFDCNVKLIQCGTNWLIFSLN